MRVLARCGLGLRGILHTKLQGSLHTNRRPSHAFSSSASNRSIEEPRLSFQKVPAPVTELVRKTPRRTPATKSSGRRHKKTWNHEHRPPSRFRWASKETPDYIRDHLYSVLESYVLNSERLASEHFPALPTTVDSDALEGDSDTPDPYDTTVKTPCVHLDADHKTYDAIVIDCEMVTLRGGQQGLSSVVVLDFFTGKILMRGLVKPTGIVTDWRRGVTGINKAKMAEAVKKGKAFANWAVVRKKIFNVTNPETIFIGHALSNDYRVLHMATNRVVDSMTLLSHAVFGDAKTFPRTWSLKSACKELLQLTVQKTRGAHDPLEDALATRELVLKFVQDPKKLTEFGENIRANMARIVQKEQEKEAAKIRKRELRKAERAKKSSEQLLQEAAEKARKKEEKRKEKAAKKAALLQQKTLKRAQKRERQKQWKKWREAREEGEHISFKGWSDAQGLNAFINVPG
ncbi:ribonuclease H-like domain-containing protein [Xylaria bambusicola]|uniref:ribonuclease H-like domain-containing protein n=1 Tax=Xylaria bambusicola TaxID=326684 RepID=UPI002008272D|nr:ribonuclease H-like domain-containing protein [Xylaria bambusicola]KAI0503255.1 ribonuclease H-like domain-containing protein [Xylaria bambusicola]